MGKKCLIFRWRALIGLIALCLSAGFSRSQPATSAAPTPDYIIVEIQNSVFVKPPEAPNFRPARLNETLAIGTQVRVGTNGAVLLQLSDQSVFRGPAKSEFILPPLKNPGARPAVRLLSGVLYFFHRGKPADIEVQTRTASAAIRGTEFAIAIDDAGITTVTMIDGLVDLSNDISAVTLQTGQQGIAEPGKAPFARAALDAINTIQWTLYYPGILDADEIGLSDREQTDLSSSLDAYRAGDLIRAANEYPTARQPQSDPEKIYFAGLMLAVGEVEAAQKSLVTFSASSTNDTSKTTRLAGALNQLIATVKLKATTPKLPPELASEWLAESYRLQSQADLTAALRAARSAAEKSPRFGFAWARIAELEFSFGHIDAASEALSKALQLSPRNAQAVALEGFLLAARNKIDTAIRIFDGAIAVDGRLANAWLGRGLCLIRKGHTGEGRADLVTAAALEPQRAFLRSYLAKAWTDAGEKTLAEHELDLAKQFDPRDPTAWLYSALLKEQYSRVNEAIRDLEHAQDLSTNRAIYRSEFKLDEDRAVRSVNLARLYADAEMPDVAVREAGRAVTMDYGNYSAHVFLANSFEIERRANLSNPRFDGPSSSEYLIASLLGPANGRLLAQPISQLEYAGLFEQNRAGLIANTEYFSRGAWRQSSAVYGTENGFGYSIEPEYRAEPGERPNQDYEIRQLEAKVKYDLTPADSLLFRIIDYEASGGDTLQHFDTSEVQSRTRFREKERIPLMAGFHHQWTPENHTLFTVGMVPDTRLESVPNAQVLALDTTVPAIGPVTSRVDRKSRVNVYTADLQQIFTVGSQTFVTGIGGSLARQDVAATVSEPGGDFGPLLGAFDPVAVQRLKAWSETGVIYAYDDVRVLDTLQLVLGLNYTVEHMPVNTSSVPLSNLTENRGRISPKAAFIWNPTPWQHFRASYTESLTGDGLSDIATLRLEPTQIGGMIQSFREPAPFSIVSQLNGGRVRTGELLWEGRFDNTFLAAGGQGLTLERNRRLGLFISDVDYYFPPSAGLIEEHVKFHEYAIEASIHQLVFESWSFGARYRGAYAELRRRFPEYIGQAYGLDEDTDWRGWLHTLTISGLYRSRDGFFGRAEGNLFIQERQREGASLNADDFWQVNVIAGYRFARQRAEIAFGVLNLLDQDYRLDPINHYADLPRSRTFYTRLLLNF